MIYLHSGRPGAGKTLFAVKRGIDWVAEGRRVYALGVNGLDHVATGILPFPGSLSTWRTALQPGDVLIVDEIQSMIRKGETLRNIPPWIEELTRNRHFGIDMLWTTQRPGNLDPFLRGLVNEHRHFVNKFGGAKAKVYLWPDGVDDPESPGSMDRAESFDVAYPIEVYGAYKSAQLHTRKRRIPKQLKMLIGASVAALVLAVVGWTFAKRHLFGQEPTAQRSGAVGHSSLKDDSAGLLGSSGGSSGRSAHVLSSKEWIERQMPRFAAMPWSAPMFDERKPLANPDIVCLSIEGDDKHPARCQCYTEQVTPIQVVAKQCKDIALHGVYNPFRKPPVQRDVAQQQVASYDRKTAVFPGSEEEGQTDSVSAQRPAGAGFRGGPTSNASGPIQWGPVVHQVEAPGNAQGHQ